jgi:hypothetical protein
MEHKESAKVRSAVCRDETFNLPRFGLNGKCLPLLYEFVCLDDFLPLVSKMALTYGDRQTRISACEMLHSAMLCLLGKSNYLSRNFITE